MNDQEFNQWLREKTDLTPIPESLSPEHIEEHLSPVQHRKKWYQHPWLNAAAGFLLLGIITASVWGIRESGIKSDHPTDTSFNDSSVSKDYAESEQNGEDAQLDETAKPASYIPSPENYKELYDIVNTLRDSYMYAVAEDELVFEGLQEMTAVNGDSVTTTPENAVDNSSTSTGRDFSDTNKQVDTVSEADIVKTDGTYIYSCYRQKFYHTNAVAIVKADAGMLTNCGSLSFEQIASDIDCRDFNIQEMYIENDRLVLLCLVNEDDVSSTGIATYDVSNPEHPSFLAYVTQDGCYMTSRLVDGYLYTFSEKNAYYNVSYDDYRTFVPYVENAPMNCYDIHLPECPTSSLYQVMTGLSITAPDAFISSKAVLSGSGNYYVSHENIYFAQYNWQTMEDETELLKFNYHEGVITPQDRITIEGHLLNQFSMDEYDGNLRIAVTNSDANALYVIDSDMKIAGCVEDIAPDECIYSVRFMEEVGYFVTYRQTDPLFSVDLSDPHHPQIMGELEIPGFSNYLHSYSENLLFGFGEEINPITQEFEGLKLSMFDVSDPYNIAEADKTILTEAYWADAQYNHKAMFIEPKKNLIGFCAVCYDEPGYEYSEKYYIYSYSEGQGFKEEIVFDIASAQAQDLKFVGNSDNTRALYIDDYLYLISGNYFSSYSLNSYKYVDGLIAQ